MRSESRHPIAVPEQGALHRVRCTIDAVFDWRLALERTRLLGLYEKGKAATWDARELDWSLDVDFERLARSYQEGPQGPLINQLMSPPRRLHTEEAVQLQLHFNAYQVSQFLHGEQGALLAAAKIVEAVPWEEAKWYAANQVSDEARHVEVYHRYLTEKVGVSYPIHPALGSLLDDIMSDSRWDVTYLGMQILVEGLALAAFGLMRFMMPDEPLIQEITKRVMADEARHVAFGVLALEDLYTRELGEHELREREDFVIEATHVLRDRLLMDPVFERLGWDVKTWLPWTLETPFHRGYRQMLFSKIVPNLKRLGLLTPRVRKAYARLDLLRFEDLKDSVAEPGNQPPAEMVQLLMKFIAEAARRSASDSDAGGARAPGPA